MPTEQNKSIASRWGKAWIFVMLAMFIALVVSGPSTNLAYAESNQVEVPVNGSISGTVTFTGPATAVLSGSGITTVLGRTTYAGNVSAITPTPTGLANVLVETFTAPNGDTLTTICTEVAVETSPGVFHGTDQWVVTGGTGRFEGATRLSLDADSKGNPPFERRAEGYCDRPASRLAIVSSFGASLLPTNGTAFGCKPKVPLLEHGLFCRESHLDALTPFIG